MIDSLEITNWKTHKRTSLRFQKGVNVLIGVMGAGKSSTVDAISFGLFGTFPALNSKRITISGLITNRPSVENDAEVRLGFSVGEDNYVVTRKLGKSGNTAKLEKNGSHLQTQPSKVTEEIEGILKIDYDTFSRVVYSEQNRLDYFLEMPKGERKRIIDHMLGLDVFATAEENSTSLINSVKGSVEAGRETLERIDIKSIREQLKSLNREKTTLAEEVTALTKEEKRLKEDAEASRKLYEKTKKQLSERKSISDEVVELQSKINTINGEVKKIERQEIDTKKARDALSERESAEKLLAKDIEELRKADRQCNKQLSDTEASIKELKKLAKEKETIMSETKGSTEIAAKKELDSANAELQKIASEIASKKGKLSEIKEWVKELDSHISKCPVCERELDEQMRKGLLDGKKSISKEMEESLGKSEKLANEISNQLKKITELHNELILAGTRLKRIGDVEKQLDSNIKTAIGLQDSLQKMQKDLEKKIEEREQNSERLAKAKSDVQTMDRLDGYLKDVGKAEATLAKKTKELESIDVDDKTLYALQEELTKVTAKLSDISSRLQGNEKYLASIDTQIKDKEKQGSEFSALEKKITKGQDQVTNLNRFKAALLETEAILRNMLVSSINNLMQSLWPRIYPYGDYVGIKLDAKRDDYALEVNTDSSSPNWFQVDGIASGGERSIGCIALRIALAMVVVPNLKWLILDEPTHNIDSSGISKLIDVLGEDLPSVVDQIFIITHDDNLKQIASAKVYQFERDKDVGASTSVIEL